MKRIDRFEIAVRVSHIVLKKLIVFGVFVNNNNNIVYPCGLKKKF
jgi:hypothetical protein